MHRRGRTAELLCLCHLRLRGYRILARRYRGPAGEIDLIVRRGGVVAAVEVKARADRDCGGKAVLARQRARIARAFEHFLASPAGISEASMLRFDVMLVVPGGWPRHLAGRMAARRVNSGPILGACHEIASTRLPRLTAMAATIAPVSQQEAALWLIARL